MNYDDELRQSPVAIGRDGDFAKLKVAKSGYTKTIAPRATERNFRVGSRPSFARAPFVDATAQHFQFPAKAGPRRHGQVFGFDLEAP